MQQVRLSQLALKRTNLTPLLEVEGLNCACRMRENKIPFASFGVLVQERNFRNLKKSDTLVNVEQRTSWETY